LLVSGCGPDKEPDEIRTIRAKYVCGPGDDESAKIQLDALGDFEPSIRTSESVVDDAKGVDLPFPLDTRGVEALAELGQNRWTGVGLAEGSDIRISLWPVEAGCALWKPSATENGFPLDAVGTSLGYSPDQRMLLVYGSSYQLGDPRALVIDVDTGVAEPIAPSETPIEFSTITAFGKDKLLIAGGSDPRGDTVPGDTALVFDTKTRTFEAEKIGLKRVRSRHGAVVLATGETLLVGGLDANQKASVALETVSPTVPKTLAASDKDLFTLAVPRVSPFVLKLSDDTIFVAGGRASLAPDAAPVTTLEYLSPDAKQSLRLIDKTSLGSIRLGRLHAFTQLPGGAVLAVGLCLAKGGNECENDPEHRNRSYAWIRPDGEIHVFQTLLPPKTTSMHLVPGSDGAPWLFAKTLVEDAWRRFDLWSGTFEIQINEPKSGPAPSPVLDACDCLQTSCNSAIGCDPTDAACIELRDALVACGNDPDCQSLRACVENESACGSERCKSEHPAGVAQFETSVETCTKAKCGPRPLASPIAIDPGLIVWLEQTQDALGNHPSVVGFRFDTRNVFAPQLAPLIATSTEHIAPNFPPFPLEDAGIEYDNGLILSSVDAIATVADTTYADVDLEIEFAGSAPLLRFGEVTVGEGTCQWPNGGGEDRLGLKRRSTTLTIARGTEQTTCSISAGRHGIALRGPGAESKILSLEIQRR
jgi:hypothetical protein